MSEQAHFNPQRVFLSLFVLTAVEVAWGAWIPYENKLLLWGGLLIMAFWKAALIFMYFMHMKFEGWIVKILIAPTPILIAIIVFATFPDVARNEDLIRPITEQYDPEQGRIVGLGESTGDPSHAEDLDHAVVGPDGTAWTLEKLKEHREQEKR